MSIRLTTANRRSVFLACLARGCGNKEIAAELQVSEQHAKRLVAGAMREFGVTRRVALVAALARSDDSRTRTEVSTHQQEQSFLPRVTPRDALILSAALEGATTKEIAARFAVSTSCVKQHLARLFAHFDVHSRAELAAVVRLIKLPEDGNGDSSPELQV